MTSQSQLGNPSFWDILLSHDDEEDDLDSTSDRSDSTSSSEERETTPDQQKIYMTRILGSKKQSPPIWTYKQKSR